MNHKMGNFIGLLCIVLWVFSCTLAGTLLGALAVVVVLPFLWWGSHE